MTLGRTQSSLFELHDPWRVSDLVTATDEPHSIFKAPENGPPPLEELSLLSQSPTTNIHLDWNLPELVADAEIPTITRLPSIGTDASRLSSHDASRHEDNLFLWDDDIVGAQEDKPPVLQTWDAFEGQKQDCAVRSVRLSELGPQAFDAVLSSLQPARKDAVVLPQDVLLRAMRNMVLGRSSVLFRWDEVKLAFDSTLIDVPASGLSLKCYRSCWMQLTDYGTRIRRLRDWAVVQPQARASRSGHSTLMALQSCVSSILHAMDERVSHRMSTIRSFLQLQRAVERPSRILRLIAAFVETSRSASTDEQLISAISDCVQSEIEVDPELAELSQFVLARITAPWLHAMCADIGLWPALPTTHASVREPDQSLLNLGDRQMVEEARSAITLLREHVPDHPLVSAVQYKPQLNLGSELPDEAGFLTTGPSALTVGQSVSGADASLYGTTSTIPQDLRFATLRPSTVSRVDVNRTEHAPWTLEPNFLAGPADETPTFHATDGLYACVTAFLRSEEVSHGDGAPHKELNVMFDPLATIRPLMQKHSQALHIAVLRHLFQASHLLQHLRTLRSFFLMDSGNFVTRLSTALFSTEAQPAERRRGVAPTADIIGLKLGTSSEQTWPPASSELQLTLMGILDDVYTSSRAASTLPVARRTALPGGLSFSVRELPEVEIERTFDVNSIYALDFLRLQYEASPPLDSIITFEALQHYDDVFRWLLRLLRLEHVASELKWRTLRRSAPAGSISDTSKRFALETHYFTQGLLVHFRDIGIEAPWRRLMRAFEDTESRLRAEDSTSSNVISSSTTLSSLRLLHDSCLERIRCRLFLKRAQQNLLKALERALNSILQCSATFLHATQMDGRGEEAALAEVRSSIARFLEALQDVTSKPAKTTNSGELEDLQMAKLLLARLDWRPEMSNHRLDDTTNHEI